jgi:uncharacterized glyoxalase superfamily protein PhnB
MPHGDVIPVLAYPDVRAAVDWLCRAFGFVERLRIGDHRSQLRVGDGSVVVAARPAGASASPGDDMQAPAGGATCGSVMVRVPDVDAHYARALAAGARLLSAPETYPYGERQYTVKDPGDHRWTFSQTVEDVDPALWGGQLLE